MPFKIEIQYLQCLVRHNTRGAVCTVRFLVKAKEDRYSKFSHYFVATAAHRVGGTATLMEFFNLDRAYDDVNAQRLAKLRGTPVCDLEEYQLEYNGAIKKALHKFFWLNDRFVPTTLDELVGNREMNLDDADTVSSLNLSQCSGDTESELTGKVSDKILVNLGFVEPTDDCLLDECNAERCDLDTEALNSMITLRMLSSKYPEQADDLRARHLAIWQEKTADLRERFDKTQKI